MKKFNVVAASAVALSAALAGGSALAHGTLAVGTANYNAAAVNAALGTITVPWNGVSPGGVFAAYTVTNNGTTATSLEVNSRFTVTLPAGFTFASTPTLTTFASTPTLTTTAPTTTVLTGGGSGSQTATFTIGTAPLTGTVALNTIAVQGATALATAGASLGITVQSTNNALVTNNDANPVPATLPTFTSDTGVNAAFAGGGALIDLSSPTLGAKFTTGLTADIGTVTLTSSGSLNAAGAPTVLSTSDTATLTISGFFNGIASATATTGAQTVTVTPVGNSLTFTGVDVAAGGTDINLIASGAALLQQNPATSPPAVVSAGQPGFTVNYAPGTSTDFLGGSATNPKDSIAYSNGQVVPVSNFLTGDDAGYTSILRVNNAGVAQTTLFALVQPYTGGPQLVGSLGTLAAGTGTIFVETDIQKAVPGLNLANSGQRATLTVIAAGAGVSSVAASDLLVNPGGVVVNVN